MKPLRFPIAGLMAAVAAVALNFAVIRSFDETSAKWCIYLLCVRRHADGDFAGPCRAVLGAKDAQW